jgi:hypothetical protein
MRVIPCLLGVLLTANAYAGTFYNPVGDPAIEAKGAIAAASLNEALSALHLMYAALERKDSSTFQKHRDAAVKSLAIAGDQFRTIESQMPSREFKPNPKTAAEKETVENFLKYTIPTYRLPPPKTEKNLVHAAAVIIESLRARLEKGDIKPGSDDWRPVREVIRIQLDLAGAGLAASLLFAPQK